MEDANFNEKESLNLIASMIAKTQERFQSNGVSFIISGYVTVIVSLIVYFALRATGDPDYNFLWFLIPVCGFLFFYFLEYRKESEKPVHTFIDSVVAKIWIVFGVVVLLLMFTSFITSLPILFIISLVISAGTALTGLVIRYPLIATVGFIGTFLSLACLFVSDYLMQILVFALIFLIIHVIPGHVLYSRYKKSTR